ncbi:hypothetical protein D4R99_05575 [bacterium]|nr:MAG: hypothetical protein D4R99_05575 [bacterium]
MGFNMPLDLVAEIRLQKHGIAIHDDSPIIRLEQLHGTGNCIQQFEIEAIRGEKVDYSENYGMEEGGKRTKKGSRCQPEVLIPKHKVSHIGAGGYCGAKNYRPSTNENAGQKFNNQ